MSVGEAVPAPGLESYDISELIVIDPEGNLILSTTNVDDISRLVELDSISYFDDITVEEVKGLLNDAENVLKDFTSLEDVDPSYAGMQVYDILHLSCNDEVRISLEKGSTIELHMHIPTQDSFSRDIIRFLDREWVSSYDEYTEILQDGTFVCHLNQSGVFAPLIWSDKTITIAITFDANSGKFPTSGETQTTYNSTELTGTTALSSIVETPTKPGYVFQGWSTTSTGAVQYTQASMPTISSDTTLYAIYEPDTTKILLEKRCCRYNSWKIEMMIGKEG